MKNIAIFASGSGSNFQAIAESFQRGELFARPVLCVCDKPGAFVVERAHKLGIPVFEFNPKEYSGKTEYEEKICRVLKDYQVDLVCLAGYMRLIGPTLLAEYRDKIINIHPSLLPAFKGAHAIRDAFDYGVKVYGVTIHFVDETLDGGKIISQRALAYDGDDIDELETRIHEIEHDLYPETINLIVGQK